jgi:hypothetical protein
VGGVGDQRQRVGGVTENQLCRNNSGIEHDPDSERRAEAVRRVGVTDMAVSVGMIMGMIVVMMVHGDWSTLRSFARAELTAGR